MEKPDRSMRLKKRKKSEAVFSASSLECDSPPAAKKAKIANGKNTTASNTLATPKLSSRTTPKDSSSHGRSQLTVSHAKPPLAPSELKKPASKKKASKRKKPVTQEEVMSDSDEEYVLPGKVAPSSSASGKVVSSSLMASKVEPASPATDVSSMQSRKKKRKDPLLASSASHAGAVLMYRCIDSAIKRGVDHRGALDSTDWASVASEVCLTHRDISLVWQIISREFEGKSLEDVLAELKPAATVSAHHLSWKDTMSKLKSEKPKAPLTAYMLYSKFMRPKFKEKYPDLTHGQLAVKIGKKWKSLSVEKQNKYREEYQKSRKEYDDKMRKFLDQHPEAMAKSSRLKCMVDKVARLKEKKPKSPPTALSLYIKDKESSVQKKHPNMSNRDIKEKLTQQWRSLSVLEMAPYRKKHIELNAKYEEDLVKFYTDHPEAEKLLMSSKAGSRKKTDTSVTASLNGTTSDTEVRGHHQDDDGSGDGTSKSEEDDGESSEEEVSEAVPADRHDYSLAAPNPLYAVKQDKVSSTPSLLSAKKVKPSSSSTPYPTKNPVNSTHHIPIIDSELSSSSSESDEY